MSKRISLTNCELLQQNNIWTRHLKLTLRHFCLAHSRWPSKTRCLASPWFIKVGVHVPRQRPGGDWNVVTIHPLSAASCPAHAVPTPRKPIYMWFATVYATHTIGCAGSKQCWANKLFCTKQVYYFSYNLVQTSNGCFVPMLPHKAAV